MGRMSWPTTCLQINFKKLCIMVSFECSFEVRTRQDAVWVLQEMISQIENDNYCGYFSYADGSWSSCGEEEPEEEDF